MDSLFANYASSDDEEADIPKKPTPPIPPPRLFSSLPLPKSHHDDDGHQSRKPTKKPPPSFFSSSLPPPKTPSSSSSALFSSLPPPKPANPPINPPPKRVVKFTPPINPSLLKSHPDDEDEAKQRKPRKDFSSPAPSKFLSSMLPAPKNSLCLAPAPASSRRSVLQADTPAVNPSVESRQEQEAAVDSGGFGLDSDASVYENYGSYDASWAGGSVDAGADGSLQPGFSSGGESSSWDMNHGGVSDYGNYAGNWSDGAMATMAQEIPDMGRIAGKRGRKEMPLEIVEVKQDELMKNRPREDQTKLTGIAFGPSYQPVSSGKGGKPSKLHKRKHQIGSLYFDMKQKEMELAERRSRGTLTKAETQAKYGW